MHQSAVDEAESFHIRTVSTAARRPSRAGFTIVKLIVNSTLSNS